MIYWQCDQKVKEKRRILKRKQVVNKLNLCSMKIRAENIILNVSRRL
jgi:hypothetical protein